LNLHLVVQSLRAAPKGYEMQKKNESEQNSKSTANGKHIINKNVQLLYQIKVRKEHKKTRDDDDGSQAGKMQ
jgi:hypothetical protein